MPTKTDYDPRYLAGVLFFNARDFFEAHEVWEDLWGATAGPDRRFYQGLIQTAVALFHFGNGNIRGATRLYRSSFDYMKPHFPHRHGLDLEAFWGRMAECFSEVLGPAEPVPSARPDPAKMPTITLDPQPESWPDPEALLPPD